ncbi:MAG TPA: hypothetical protein VLD55_03765 [Candidatus Sulfobium mesophilum]|nr:hypothetical protein [Candidatus Sulfobium mesophilum]
MKTREKDISRKIAFTDDNSDNIKKVLEYYKNVLICGVKGVGKITNTVKALSTNANVYYVGNPVDYEGKTRPGSYEKYLKYILSLRKDIRIVDDIAELFTLKDEITLIVDEIYGRSEEQLSQISRLADMKNIRMIQIVGCMKYMGVLIDKVDAIIELHLDGAFMIDKDLARAICEILGKKE